MPIIVRYTQNCLDVTSSSVGLELQASIQIVKPAPDHDYLFYQVMDMSDSCGGCRFVNCCFYVHRGGSYSLGKQSDRRAESTGTTRRYTILVAVSSMFMLCSDSADLYIFNSSIPVFDKIMLACEQCSL